VLAFCGDMFASYLLHLSFCAVIMEIFVSGLFFLKINLSKQVIEPLEVENVGDYMIIDVLQPSPWILRSLCNADVIVVILYMRIG